MLAHGSGGLFSLEVIVPFAKLDNGILDSSLWSEPPSTRCVWITFLAKKDENGFVASSYSGMQRASNVTLQEFDAAIKTLESPDKDSRTPDFDGRRIEKIDGGWVVLNHEKYRLHDDVVRELTRERVRKYRERKKVDVTQGNVTSTLPSVSVSESVSGSLSSSSVLGGAGGEKYGSDFLEFWKLYPKKVGKAAAQRSWIIHVKKKAVPLPVVMKALEWQRKCDQWTKDNGQFVPNPETWLNQGRWNDEPQEILTPAYKPPVFLGA
jgi:hypothetical protein